MNHVSDEYNQKREKAKLALDLSKKATEMQEIVFISH